MRFLIRDLRTDMDIRSKTCLIVRKNRYYLVGWDGLTKGPSWSQSKYDAWRTRDVKTAKRVARKCGGTLMLFNPIAGQIAIYAGRE